MLDQLDSIKDAKKSLRAIDVELELVEEQINELIRKFNRTYTVKPHAHLTKAKGRGLVWRSRGSKPQEQFYFTFASDRADEFLDGLPALTKRNFVDVEVNRIKLQMRKKNLEYQRRLINDWIKHMQSCNRIKADIKNP